MLAAPGCILPASSKPVHDLPKSQGGSEFCLSSIRPWLLDSSTLNLFSSCACVGALVVRRQQADTLSHWFPESRRQAAPWQRLAAICKRPRRNQLGRALRFATGIGIGFAIHRSSIRVPDHREVARTRAMLATPIPTRRAVPIPAEVRAAAARIRRAWSPQQRVLRQYVADLRLASLARLAARSAA